MSYTTTDDDRTKQKAELFTRLINLFENASKEFTTPEVEALYEEARRHQPNISINSFKMILEQMRGFSFDGIPYIDCRTYKKWKEEGFYVLQGEHSLIQVIAWVSKDKDEEQKENTDKENDTTKGKSYSKPIIYYLFHRSQVIQLERPNEQINEEVKLEEKQEIRPF